MKLPALSAAMLLLATTTVAQDIVACLEISEDAARLQCYDGLAGERATAQLGEWEFSSNRDLMTDRDILTLVLRAHSTTDGPPPFLALQCRGPALEIYIDWQTYLGSDGILGGAPYKTVVTRFDDERQLSRAWALSTNTRAAFWRGDPQIFLTHLRDGAQLIASNPRTAIFGISDFAHASEALSGACMPTTG